MKTRRLGGGAGFTLMELLVAIALSAVLTAVCFSMFRAARSRGRQTVSVSNLRQLAAANLLYAADRGTYCPAGEPSNKIRWHGGRTSAGSRFDPAKGFLAEYLGDSRSVGICPEFRPDLTGSGSWENGSGGYGYNDTYIGGQPEDPFKPNRPANVGNPSRTLMFATTALAKSNGVQEYASAAPPKAVDANGKLRGDLQPSVHFRFNGSALIAWCDGHVSDESRSFKSKTNFYGGDNHAAQIGFCGPTDNNGWWNPRN